MLTKPNNAKKKSASTIGKSLIGPTLMVLKGLGRMSWLYYDTYKLLDVLIFSEQDDKRLKKSELFNAVLLKYSSKGCESHLRISICYFPYRCWKSSPFGDTQNDDSICLIKIYQGSRKDFYQSLSYFSDTQSLIFFNKRNKLEIEAKVTIGVKWTFQAVAKIG